MTRRRLPVPARYGRRARLVSAVAILSAALATSADAQRSAVADFSLEELMSLRLTGMALTNIHHVHPAGEWMVGYQYMRMGMEGNLVGTRSISVDQVHTDFGYMVAPEKMDMNMHMFDLMYGVTDWLTVMAMVPYKSYSMDLEARMGPNDVPFTTRSSGVGDFMLSGLFSLFDDRTHRIVFELGVSFPTGSIDATDVVPMGGGTEVVLGYPMQLGTGSYALRPGLTYLGQSQDWLWGGHFDALAQLDENDAGYKVGERYVLSAWVARLVVSWLSVSFRPEYIHTTEYDGADPRLNPMMAPTNDPSLRGGKRLDFLFGVNLFGTEGIVKGQRLALEAGLPGYQSLDGPQLETDYRLTLSWNWVF